MSKLLVVSGYSDKDFISCDYTFVYHQISGLARFFEEIYVVAPAAYIPAVLDPLGRFSDRIRLRRSKVDYQYDNVKVFFAHYWPWAGRFPRGDKIRAHWKEIERTVDAHGLEYDLVHSHATWHGWYGLQLARRRNVPSVLTIHDNHDGLMRGLDGSRPDKIQAVRESDAVIRVSPTDIPDIQRLASTDRHIHYIPNGFDASQVSKAPRETLRRALGLPARRVIFVGVARWLERKDPMILVEALARLEPDGNSERPLLILIGQDLMGGEVQTRAAALGIGDDVQMLGQRSPEDVLRYMRASDAVVLYSLSEGNPTVMFEALGCGRPYLGSDVGGVRAVIGDDRLGYYGPARDVGRLAEMMDDARKRDWDEDYILEYAQQFTWEHIGARIHSEVFGPLLAR